MPDLIAHRGMSLGRFADHMWLSTEGVFGIAIGVSTSTVFLYVLFGTLLDQAGAGNYFMKLCFALLGHLRGGPAKAAVVSSALNGLFSGSAIANVVTGGLFTIPLMKRVGFSPEKAAAVEVSSSLNGQIMPPVMGAAAFLIAESVGVPYVEVVTSAFIPAVISYIALFYIVHLEAVKTRMPIIPRRNIATPAQRLLGWTGTAIVSFAATAILYYGLGALRGLLPSGATLVTLLLFAAAYVALLWNACRYPPLELDDPSARIYELPETWPTLMAGLHHLLPVVVLIWGLMVDEMSAGLAAYWAILALVVIILTQRPLSVLIRGEGDIAAEMRLGWHDLLRGLVAGGRNMAGVAIAMASAGIVVGVVSLTGIGLLMTEIINDIAGGHLMAALILTALITLVLGMGLPTTANYVVVAAVMAPVLPVLAAQNGLLIPAMAVHLFIFYFGLLSGVTPPVAVDAYAGAALARSNPIQTCMYAFYYSIRTAILPFIFIFNTDLLLIGVDSIWHFALILAISIIAMLLFVAVTHHWFLVRCRVWESAALLLICFTLFRPGFWLDQWMPPYRSVPPQAIFEQAAAP
jgi:TRAP transporter 4TM/12TM fusion protein